MNPIRLLTFVAAFLLLQIAVGFISGGLLENVLGGVASMLLFAALGRTQAKRPYFFAILIIALAEALAFGILFVLDLPRSESPLWWLDWLFIALSAVLGIELGKRWRSPISP